MQALTMEDAICDFPNMVTVLRCFAPLLKGKVSKVLMMKDVSDAAYMCVDSDIDGNQLFEFYSRNVPERITNANIGGASMLKMRPSLPEDIFTDVTHIAQEVWNET